jgi:hypothetical protein
MVPIDVKKRPDAPENFSARMVKKATFRGRHGRGGRKVPGTGGSAFSGERVYEFIF